MTARRDIIRRRMSEVSAEIDRVAAEHRAAPAPADIGAALLAAMNYSGEMVRLGRQHGDLWREFLDTL
jgi:hypothetical protein